MCTGTWSVHFPSSCISSPSTVACMIQTSHTCTTFKTPLYNNNTSDCIHCRIYDCFLLLLFLYKSPDPFNELSNYNANKPKKIFLLSLSAEKKWIKLQHGYNPWIPVGAQCFGTNDTVLCHLTVNNSCITCVLGTKIINKRHILGSRCLPLFFCKVSFDD